MSITFTDEQPARTAQLQAGQPGGAQSVTVQQPDIFGTLASEVKGCYGFLKFIEVCVSADPSSLTASVEVKIFGDTVAKGTISAAHPCLKVDVHPHAGGIGVKLEVEICLDIAGKRVTIDGKACVDYLIGHKCAHLHDHTILHF